MCDERGVSLPKTPEPYYWAPTAEGGMTADDLSKLWRPTLWFGTTQNASEFRHVFWRDSLRQPWADKERYVVSNFPRDMRLETALSAMLDFFKVTALTPVVAVTAATAAIAVTAATAAIAVAVVTAVAVVAAVAAVTAVTAVMV